MKNQSECYQALLVGETLIKAEMTIRKLLNGELVDADDKTVLDEGFNFPDIWQIYKEPKWYENIPDGGVLCFAGDMRDERFLRIVTDYYPDDKDKFWVRNGTWKYAKPLTKSEIQVFMDNAPEDL